jgi:small subunit ribosomal protein S5
MAYDPQRGPQRRRDEEPQDGIYEHVLQIKRVSKKTTGGSNISFTALVVVGDRKSQVGLGFGRGSEVPQAIQKGVKAARKHMITVPVYEDTLPHDLKSKFKSARIILKPAPQGTGLKVGSVLRSILSSAGITNASGKLIGSRNQTTNAYAVMEALKTLKARA